MTREAGCASSSHFSLCLLTVRACSILQKTIQQKNSLSGGVLTDSLDDSWHLSTREKGCIMISSAYTCIVVSNARLSTRFALLACRDCIVYAGGTKCMVNTKLRQGECLKCIQIPSWRSCTHKGTRSCPLKIPRHFQPYLLLLSVYRFKLSNG